MLAAHERPAVVVVAATPFSVAGGELTANLKLRRGAVFARHAAALDAAFAALAADGARDRMPPVVRAPLHG
jgi:long-chain acyl-CoA synthetase